VKKSSNYKLHGRITMMLLVIAIVSTLSYSAFMMMVVDRFEHAMLGTLVGHEIDELMTELLLDPEAKLPTTASVNAYLSSRESSKPIPDFLKGLSSDVHTEIRDGEKYYEVAIIDLADDRIYLTFDTTNLSIHRSTLMMMHVGGALFASFVVMISGFWLSRKFFLPVSKLAEEVSGIDPNDRKIRIEEKYRGYEVGLIARSIDQFLDKLDDFVEREQSFTAAVSHELRTPISVITTAIDLLELRGVTDIQQGPINRIKESSRYMGKVIESLLFFARNTRDVVEKTLPVINPDEIFQIVLEQYKEPASKKKLTLLYKNISKIKVRMSENHLEIILGNLLRNAIDNTDGGEVKVSLFENGFSVKDTGFGIEADEIDLIVKLNYHGANSQGSGLGLYLVVNICNIYGLKLEIESTIGEGSEFSVIFPENIIS